MRENISIVDISLQIFLYEIVQIIIQHKIFV